MKKNIENKLEEIKKYSYAETLESSLNYFKGDELAATTWINKYAVKDKNNSYLELNPDDMHRRMAKEFVRIENSYDTKINKEKLSDYGKSRDQLTEGSIYNLFKDFGSVIPQGSIMSSLGDKDTIASLSNCVVIPEVHDSYGGIMYADQQMAQLFKRRCGVGVDISNLRPKNSDVKNAAKTTSGAVSFMNRFSSTTREVAQNGRRGALMLTMDIAHPDVEDFVTIKQDLTKVTGANISVKLSDEFMNAVDEGKKYTHKWPIDSKNPKITKNIEAKTLWDKIIKSARNTAEPGLLFWDRQHKYSTSSIYPGFENSATNPCGEIAMQGGDSCRLIALNFYDFVKNPFTKEAEFDYDKLSKTTYEAQRLSDDLVDLELEAVDKIRSKIMSDDEPDYIKKNEIETWNMMHETGKKGRRTGLGFTGLADTFAALGFKYDSEQANKTLDEIMKTKLEAEFNSSIDMAIERGKFDGFDTKYENTSDFVKMMEKEFPDVYTRMMDNGRRNISISTAAPTGSLSMLAGVSAGIEPVFLTNYKRRRKVDKSNPNAKIDYTDKSGDSFEEFDVYHHKLKKWMEVNNRTDIENSPYAGSTAPEIDWLKRLDTQAIAQKYITHSISSTINLPEDVSTEKVSEIYMQAWKKGLKGITIYRDGSRDGILVSKENKGLEGKIKGFPEERPREIDAEVLRFNNLNENGKIEPWISFVGTIDKKPYEIFTGKIDEDVLAVPNKIEKGKIVKEENGSTHYDFHYTTSHGYNAVVPGISHQFDKSYWNNARLISGMLRNELPVENIVDMIEKLNDVDGINSWKSGTVRALKKYIKNGTKSKEKCEVCEERGDIGLLVYEEGCLKCANCGTSKCG